MGIFTWLIFSMSIIRPTWPIFELDLDVINEFVIVLDGQTDELTGQGSL